MRDDRGPGRARAYQLPEPVFEARREASKIFYWERAVAQTTVGATPLVFDQAAVAAAWKGHAPPPLPH